MQELINWLQSVSVLQDSILALKHFDTQPDQTNYSDRVLWCLDDYCKIMISALNTVMAKKPDNAQKVIEQHFTSYWPPGPSDDAKNINQHFCFIADVVDINQGDIYISPRITGENAQNMLAANQHLLVYFQSLENNRIFNYLIALSKGSIQNNVFKIAPLGPITEQIRHLQQKITRYMEIVKPTQKIIGPWDIWYKQVQQHYNGKIQRWLNTHKKEHIAQLSVFSSINGIIQKPGIDCIQAVMKLNLEINLLTPCTHSSMNADHPLSIQNKEKTNRILTDFIKELRWQAIQHQLLGFSSKLGELNRKVTELAENSQAKIVASELHVALSTAENQLKADLNVDAFTRSCRQLIEQSRPELEKHRGWAEFLIYLSIAVFTAGIVPICYMALNNGNSFFKITRKTHTANILDALDSQLEKCNSNYNSH